LIVVQVDRGLHQRPLQLGTLGRVRILLQMILNREHEFNGTVAGFAKSFLQAGLFGR